jgi:hypothetical protein
MNSERRERPGLVYLLAIVGAFLIVGLLILGMYVLTRPAPIGEDRGAVRAKGLAELRAAEAEALNNAAWIDRGKGVVRLRIEDAMQLVVREWQDPPAARSNLVARAEKALAMPAPPPEKPSPFE